MYMNIMNQADLIEKNLGLQIALAEMIIDGLNENKDQLTVFLSDIMISNGINCNPELKRSDLELLFQQVMMDYYNHQFYYIVSRPKSECREAFRECAASNRLNKWVNYFCVGKLRETNDGSMTEKCPIHGDNSKDYHLEADPEWKSFVDYYLKRKVWKNGYLAIMLPRFEIEEALIDHYVKQLAGCFPDTYLEYMDLETENDEKILLLKSTNFK